ncbi:sulfhydryl oxidase 2-like isoform X1 [Cucurbita pepo subsp. pepo]|uniref:sulfhydryl oxidase 2-like isoform X1 n=1 Tax=Cucurbita pepo subsp. pepo TaxID=3664 RepID=UPI000C9D5D9C|nr:sulfhydryl oxidase 2-like isoform X1 [Cucurbita pepo subsp. pepo]XP_023541104.1 sulfhydryl oxidase 2-like isoform X1 [Cucurbita pepo subsp. pepo]
MSRTLLVLIVCLSALRFGTSLGSRSILRTVADKNGDSEDYAIDLNATNFDAVFRDAPASFAVVEFFAHWCPACRNYKPHYERVARLFNGPNAVHPGKVLMTRVDCALKMNTNLCDKFSVGHFPMLFWGPPSNFVSGSWNPKEEKSEIRNIDDGRTAEKLLNWMNKQMGSSYGLDDQTFENEHLSSNISDPGQIARAVYDVEEATSTAFDIILEHKMINSETRAPFIKFLQLLVVHHPSVRCRRGSAEILVNFDELSLADMKQEEVASEKGAVKNFQICGKDVPRGYWIFCRGSKNDTRGFSCGLWVLLHSLSVRIEDGESQFAFTAICDFIRNFFVCEECRQHFHEMCSSVSSPFNKARDFALWLWRAHNKVNERLLKEEESMGTADPKFPKMIWPPPQLCSSCYLSHSSKQIKWDENVVHKFLTNYYGKMLVSLYKSNSSLGNVGVDGALDELATSTNAVAVPVGAALAIALASCAFGVLACYWRSQQKSRKPRRSSELKFCEGYDSTEVK